jgi:hypothetical protein
MPEQKCRERLIKGHPLPKSMQPAEFSHKANVHFSSFKTGDRKSQNGE